MVFDEEAFKTAAKKDILQCRPGDWNHAQRVAEWVKRLEPPEKRKYLLAAAYIHDIGWKGLLDSDEITLDQLQALENRANTQSEPRTRALLGQLGWSEKDIQTVLRLIEAADRHEARNEIEAYIVDADNLSKLCIKHLEEKYARSEWERVADHWEDTLPKRMQTAEGKKLWKELLAQLRRDIQNA